MNKLFNKAVLNGTTIMGDGLTYPRIPNVYTGDNEGGYQRGDMMDANAVVEMIKELTGTGEITIEELQNLINEEIQERVEGDQDQQRYTDQKIKDLIGTSPETLDTLKEIADALGEDPDFAANVWNKIAELTTKHNEDVQELQNAITSGFENIDFTSYVKKTDVVTDTTNGLMLAADKQKLDDIPSNVMTNIKQRSPENKYNVTLEWDYKDMKDGLNKGHDIVIFHATEDYAGVMSAPDKVKLDGIETGAQVNTIESVSVNGTPLEITDKGVDIPIHEYTAGDCIKLENGNTFSLMRSEDDAPFSEALYQDQSKSCVFIPFVDILGPESNPIKIDCIYRGVYINHVSAALENSGTSLGLGLISLKDYNKFNAKQDALTEVQLNNINNAITSISINNIGQVNTNGAVDLTIPIASITENGLMSKEDKAKLDAQPFINASDTPGLLDNDYVVIKKSELDSILSRLSALENNA